MSGHASEADLKLIGHARAATKRHPDDAAAWIRLGRLLLEPAHSPEEAIDAFQRALAVDPTSVAARFWAAEAFYHELLNTAVAARLLEEALQIDPRNPECLSLLASIRRDEGAPVGDVLSLARRAVDAAPDWKSTRALLVEALLDAGQPEEARAELAALEGMPTLKPPPERLQADFEETITGRSGPILDIWRNWVARRLGEPSERRRG